MEVLNLGQAKAAFRGAWTAFKAAAGPEQLAQAFETQDDAKSKVRN